EKCPIPGKNFWRSTAWEKRRCRCMERRFWPRSGRLPQKIRFKSDTQVQKKENAYGWLHIENYAGGYSSACLEKGPGAGKDYFRRPASCDSGCFWLERRASA